MMTDADLSAYIAENAVLEPGHPLRNDLRAALSQEILDLRAQFCEACELATSAAATAKHEAAAARLLREQRPRETTATIAAWQRETFGAVQRVAWAVADAVRRRIGVAMWKATDAGNKADLGGPARPNLSRAIRAAGELAELIERLVADDDDPKAPEECADITIVLAGISAAYGVEQSDAIDAKMAINRTRKWHLTGDGHAQHIEEPK